MADAAGGHLPIIPVDPEALHAQKIVDFSDEEELKKHVRKSRWLALDVGAFKVRDGLSFLPHVGAGRVAAGPRGAQRGRVLIMCGHGRTVLLASEAD